MNFTHHGCVASLQLHIVIQLRFPVQAVFIKSYLLKVVSDKTDFSDVIQPYTTIIFENKSMNP